MKDDDEYLDWEVPECENCIRTAHHAMWHDNKEIPEKWICLGNISEPANPDCTHDLVNKIRICIRRNEDKAAEQFEWTPYEASLVSAFLIMAISNELYEDQPYLDADNNLVFTSLHKEGNVKNGS